MRGRIVYDNKSGLRIILPDILWRTMMLQRRMEVEVTVHPDGTMVIKPLAFVSPKKWLKSVLEKARELLGDEEEAYQLMVKLNDRDKIAILESLVKGSYENILSNEKILLEIIRMYKETLDPEETAKKLVEYLTSTEDNALTFEQYLTVSHGGGVVTQGDYGED